MMQFSMLYSIIPLLLFMVIIGAMKKTNRHIRHVALIGSVLPALFIPYLAMNIGASESYGWIGLAALSLPITASNTIVNFVMFSLVSIVAPFVFLYSTGYMDNQIDDKRYYLELLAFQAAMTALSLSGNFILLFIAWEFLSVTSYLLIGFYNTGSAKRAARKAITTIIIGDIAMLAAMALLWNSYSTLEFSQLAGVTSFSAESLAAVALLIIAVFTKSAQFPFTSWLVDAMEGPTPVSAFLHSSTMVKAGVFLVLLLFPMFKASGMLNIILAISLITAIIAVANGIGETHIKKVLAFSTIEELSIMLVAASLLNVYAALYIFIVQTFYKALLFFYSGILYRANGTEDITKMRNAANMKPLMLSGVIGVFALTGLIPFSTFFADSMLDAAAFSSGIGMLAIIIIIDLLLSVMMFRWLLLPYTKEVKKASAAELDLQYKLVGKPMLYSLYAFAFLSIASPAILFSKEIFGGAGIFQFISLQEFVLADAIVIIGALIGYTLMKRKRTPYLNVNGYIDAAYSDVAYFFSGASIALERFEYLINRAFGLSLPVVYGTSMLLKNVQDGRINTYAFVFVAGLILLFAFFALKM